MCTKFPTYPYLEKITKYLKTLLSAEYLAAFRAFLQSEYSDENIEFWLACEDFRSTTSADKVRWKAEAIYKEFIQPMARREVSLPITLQLMVIKQIANRQQKETMTFCQFIVEWKLLKLVRNM